MTQKRGLLIVFEGCDRSGKSTQCQKLVDAFNISVNSGNKNSTDIQQRAVLQKFPDRTTSTGQIINSYLQRKPQAIVDEEQDLMDGIGDKHMMHLLFSANRWEQFGQMKKTLLSGRHVICDRYAYSGVVYSHVALGLDLQWCMQPDKGLLRPDIVFYMDSNYDSAEKQVSIQNRDGFGDELYERADLQRKLNDTFKRVAMCGFEKIFAIQESQPSYQQHNCVKGSSFTRAHQQWVVVDANRSIDDIHESIRQVVQQDVEKLQENELSYDPFN
ncbi:hypothetical protein MP228_001725 [Amoeboaphelidium protococcarum]|nr:hypothetical protein MP228_001725 [Amoeboaphelidium protococcarum]